MSKLQMIKRANSTLSYSVNLPIAMIKDLDWEKGEEIGFSIIDGKILIYREIDDGSD